MLNKGLEEGRTLLMNQAHNNSLAAEFEAMSENEVSICNLQLKCVPQPLKSLFFITHTKVCTKMSRNQNKAILSK